MTHANTKKPAPKKPAAKRPAPKKPAAKKPAPKKPATKKRPPARAAIDRVAFTLYEVDDPARARAFYEDVLGLRRGLASPTGTWTEYDLPGGGCLALFKHPAKPFTASGGAALALEVRDLDAFAERLRAAGVRFVGDVIRGPHCRMYNVLDSEGNALILHELDRG